MKVNESQLVGTRVVSQDGYVIGDVAHLLIDTASWRIVEFGIKLRRDSLEPLRLKKPLLGSQTVQLPAEEISGVSDAVVLRHRRDELAFMTGGEPPPTEQERLEEEEETPPPTIRPGGASPSSPR